MDGRVQLPVINWMKATYHLDYIDMVTEPGPDGILVAGASTQIESIKSRVTISVNAHGSNIIMIVGHHDCAGNPVSKEVHLSQTRKAMDIIKSWNLFVNIIVGVWVDDNWAVKPIGDPIRNE
jgi:hypothetical protein